MNEEIEEIEGLSQSIADGKMKLVETTVLLAVPSHITLETVEQNIETGVSFIIEEHVFVDFEEDDTFEGDNVVDDVYWFKVTSSDVDMKGSK